MGARFTRLRWWGVAAALACGACGRWGFDPLADDAAPGDAAAPDAAVVDAAEADARADAAVLPRCTAGPFGAPQLVSDVGLAPELFGASLTSDGTTLFFSHLIGSPDSEDIYQAQRPAIGAAFGSASLVANVNTAVQDGTPFVTADSLGLLFSSERAGGAGGRDIWLATRADPSGSFALDRNLTELNTRDTEHTPSMTADGRLIYFGSNRNGPGAREDLFSATRASTAVPFDPPVRDDVLSSGGFDGSVFISQDGLSIYFMSDRPGASGCDNIWTAARATRDVPFDAPTPVTEVNSSDCEDDPALSADGCELFFSSNRAGDGYRLYRATRTP